MGRSRAFAVVGLVVVIAVAGAAFALDGSDDPVAPAVRAEPASDSGVPVTTTASAPETTRRVTWVAGGIGVVVAGALAIGRHDELVTTLTRWTRWTTT